MVAEYTLEVFVNFTAITKLVSGSVHGMLTSHLQSVFDTSLSRQFNACAARLPQYSQGHVHYPAGLVAD